MAVKIGKSRDYELSVEVRETLSDKMLSARDPTGSTRVPFKSPRSFLSSIPNDCILIPGARKVNVRARLARERRTDAVQTGAAQTSCARIQRTFPAIS